MMAKAVHLDASSTGHYRMQFEKGMKLAKFHGDHVRIDGKIYRLLEFINSGDYNIREVICFSSFVKGTFKEVFHVWYEDKEIESEVGQQD